MASITLRVPLQQYGYLEVTGESAQDVLFAAESSLTSGLHAKGIEIEKVALATDAIGTGTQVISTPETPPAFQTQAPPPAFVQQAPPVQASAPVQVSPPPAQAGAEVRMCPHGQRKHASGNSAKGPWQAWFCALEKGTPGECAPQWK